ncbi:hypothetical protein BUALT_Bualt02G0034900 [Buddleja alternifolia]|uniref:Taste receptor type 2 n=1 Tax=Buddleja alternifolia TaxID=168488 RepID=A0AAV6XZ92_9LAMI|nr:hypothetical protein BUALT_Bualt02G0034900 [Buddleja alternifolia]
MEIPALVYFSCWSLISITFLLLGFKALHHDKPEIAPLVIFLLKRVLAICVCHSSSYALVHRPGANISLLSHLKVSIIGFSIPVYIYIVSGPIPLRLILCYAFLVILCLSFLTSTLDFGLSIDFLIRAMIFSLEPHTDRFFPIFVLVTSFFSSGSAALLDGPVGPGPVSEPVKNDSKKRKGLEIAVSILCSIVFQILVRFTSFSHILAFLCFAVVWLGFLALVMPQSDLGVLDLLLCNVLVGCVNGFGLYGPTWFAYVAYVVLYVLHSKVRTVRLVHDQDIVLW